MKIGIGNINSLQIGNRIEQTSRALARSFERLASGLRVSSPSDDSAAYSLGIRLDSQLRGIGAANQNINESLGLVNTATFALDQLQDLVLEMQQIARVGSDSDLTQSQREELQTSLSSLFVEFNRIRSSTEYGDFNLLDGSAGSLQFQVGAQAGDAFNLNLGQAQGVVASGSTDVVSIFGLGTFSGSLDTDAGTGELRTASGDIDNDGDIDYVIADVEEGELLVNSNDGSGSFSNSDTIATKQSSLQIELVDINRDGNLDMVESGANATNFYLGNGDGTFQAPTCINGAGGYFDLVDLDNDDNQDLVFQESGDDEVYIYLGESDGTFTAAQTIVLSGVRDLAPQFADFDNDNDLDLFVTTSDGLRIFENNGLGSFVETQSFSGLAQNQQLALGDFNGDGFVDFVVDDSDGGTLTQISLLLGNGDGTFTNGATITAAASQVDRVDLVADFDRDGDLDILVLDTDFRGEILYNNGDGTFVSGNIFLDSAAGLNFGEDGVDNAVVSDIDGDGDMDFIISGAFTSGAATDQAVAIYLNDGSGTLALDATYVSGFGTGTADAQLQSLIVEDLDGDGVTDVLGVYRDRNQTLAGGGFYALTQDTDSTTETFNYGVSVLNEFSAANLETVLDNVLSEIQSQRADVAAVHSRLSISLESNLLIAEDLSQARSNAIGIDIVDEVLESVTQQFLFDAQAAALSQSNLNSASVLVLLESLE